MDVFCNAFVIFIIDAIARFTADMQGRIGVGTATRREPLFPVKSEQQVCSHPQAQAPATLISGRQQQSWLLFAQLVTVHLKFVISTLPVQ